MCELYVATKALSLSHILSISRAMSPSLRSASGDRQQKATSVIGSADWPAQHSLNITIQRRIAQRKTLYVLASAAPSRALSLIGSPDLTLVLPLFFSACARTFARNATHTHTACRSRACCVCERVRVRLCHSLARVPVWFDVRCAAAERRRCRTQPPSMCSLRLSPAGWIRFSVDETLSGDAEIPQRSAASALWSRVERVCA